MPRINMDLTDILKNVQERTSAVEIYVSDDSDSILAVSDLSVEEKELHNLLASLGTDTVNVQIVKPKSIKHDILTSLANYVRVFDGRWIK